MFRGVFGKDGLFRRSGTTTILATHSSKYAAYLHAPSKPLLTNVVKRLPQADWILAIDEAGQIAEQGTFPDLNVPGNYVYGLKIKLNEQSQETNQGESVHEFVERAEGKQTSTRVSDGSRQTGDWATYKYYSRTLGLMSIMLFLSAIAVNETASGMQCMFPSIATMRNR